MKTFMNNFYQSEDGAVTIDWVVLTAAVLVLGIIVGISVSNGATTMADNTGTALETATVPSVSF